MTASRDGTVGLWDAGTWERRHTFRGDERYMLGVAFVPDRPAVVAVGADGLVRVWASPR